MKSKGTRNARIVRLLSPLLLMILAGEPLRNNENFKLHTVLIPITNLKPKKDKKRDSRRPNGHGRLLYSYNPYVITKGV
jgi:hypothetical protein